MSELEMTQVFVRTKAGRIHRAAIVNGGRPLVNESCNLDDAPGEEEIVDQAVVEAADHDELCRQPTCFPERL